MIGTGRLPFAEKNCNFQSEIQLVQFFPLKTRLDLVELGTSRLLQVIKNFSVISNSCYKSIVTNSIELWSFWLERKRNMINCVV